MSKGQLFGIFIHSDLSNDQIDILTLVVLYLTPIRDGESRSSK